MQFKHGIMKCSFQTYIFVHSCSISVKVMRDTTKDISLNLSSWLYYMEGNQWRLQGMG